MKLHVRVAASLLFITIGFPAAAQQQETRREPKHLVESLNWQLYWFDKYVNGNAAAVPPDRVPVGDQGAKAASSGN